jgi:hypothetical protein
MRSGLFLISSAIVAMGCTDLDALRERASDFGGSDARGGDDAAVGDSGLSADAGTVQRDGGSSGHGGTGGTGMSGSGGSDAGGDGSGGTSPACTDGASPGCDDRCADDEGKKCTAGVGECARTGVYECNAAHDATECSATAGTPVTEICGNDKDDDCDEKTDEAPETHDDCSACGAACAGSLACDGGACAQAAVSLALWEQLSCALLNPKDGNGAYPLSCWGKNDYDQLRNGTGQNRATPGAISGGNVRAVSVGASFVCTLDDGSDDITCWGTNDFQQLGDSNGSTTENTFTVSGAVELSSGYHQSCARTNDGKVECWGESANVQSDMAYPTRELVFSAPVVELAAGNPLGCARLNDGSVQCWGAVYGDDAVFTPRAVVDTGDAALTHVTRVVAMAGAGAPAAHGCALRSSNGGEVWCWGYNLAGELGHTSDGGIAFEKASKVALSDVIDVSVGLSHSCALVSSGQVYCWGESKAATGGGSGSISTPTAISGLDDAIDIASGMSHNCARRRSGQVSCWGTNASGELGDGTTVDRTSVVDTKDLP